MLIRVSTSFFLSPYDLVSFKLTHPIDSAVDQFACNRRLYRPKLEERIQTACPLSCGPRCIENQIDLALNPLSLVPPVRPTP